VFTYGIEGVVVTPRHGKPVEIEALRYNALRSVAALAVEYGDAKTAHRLNTTAVRARRHFVRLFWNDQAGCLYDVVRGDERDGSIRPNQIIAVSLPFMMLTGIRPSRSSAARRVSCSRRTDCGRLRRRIPGIGGATKATRPGATRVITRARHGRG